jgi:hypothetical protein
MKNNGGNIMAIHKLDPKLQAKIDAVPKFTFEEAGVEPSGKIVARNRDEFQKFLKEMGVVVDETEKPRKTAKKRISSGKARRCTVNK